MRWLIDRTYLDDGVIGNFYDENNQWMFHSIERPWLNNQPSISCIPAGIYICQFGYYNRGGYDCYDVLNVADRTYIKIHIANWPRNVKGCIGIGKTRDDKVPAVWSSGDAFKEWMGIMNGLNRFKLEIKNDKDNRSEHHRAQYPIWD